MDKAKVYFTKEITPESVIKMYEKIGKELYNKHIYCKRIIVMKVINNFKVLGIVSILILSLGFIAGCSSKNKVSNTI